MIVWNRFFKLIKTPSYTDYIIRERHRLPQYPERKDIYVLVLNGNPRRGHGAGVNWRFSSAVPEELVQRAHALAKKEFTDMNVEDLDQNPKTGIYNIRIRRNDIVPITDDELHEILERVAPLITQL